MQVSATEGRICAFSQAFFFIGFHVTFKRGVTCVPSHIEQAEANLAEAGVCRVEVGGIHNALYQFVRYQFSGLVMAGKRMQEFLFDGKFSMNWEGSSTKSQYTLVPLRLP